MVENLRTTRYNDGTPIPVVPDNLYWSSLTTGAILTMIIRPIAAKSMETLQLVCSE